MTNYGRQSINQNDIDAVVQVLQSDFLTQGPAVPAFESALCAYTGAAYCTAVSNATSALHLACLALGVGYGDRVWTSPISFVASANCARYCGAQIDFVDIELETGLMSIHALRDKLEFAASIQQLPKVVIPVHYAGQSCDMRELYKLSKRYDFSIIEDASHALGAQYLQHKVGGAEYSDAVVFSFHPVKMITTGEGGAITTRRLDVDEKVKHLRSHGIKKGNDIDEPWRQDQVALGFNYRLSDMQCALGISQLARLDAFVEKRTQIAKIYEASLPLETITVLTRRDNQISSLHLYPILSKDAIFRKKLYFYLKGYGINAQVHYCPIHRHTYYIDHLKEYYEQLHQQKKGYSKQFEVYEQAEAFYNRVLSLPIYPDLAPERVSEIIDCISHCR